MTKPCLYPLARTEHRKTQKKQNEITSLICKMIYNAVQVRYNFCINGNACFLIPRSKELETVSQALEKRDIKTHVLNSSRFTVVPWRQILKYDIWTMLSYKVYSLVLKAVSLPPLPPAPSPPPSSSPPPSFPGPLIFTLLYWPLVQILTCRQQ